MPIWSVKKKLKSLLMLLFDLRNSHKCLTCFTLSALPPPAGWIIHDGEVTVLLEIGRFIFLTAHILLCYILLQRWSQVRCWDLVTLWQLPNPPAPHPATPGSPPNTKYCSLLLSATSSPRASSQITPSQPWPPALPGKCSRQHRLQKTQSVSTWWANTFPTLCMSNHC